uniref:Uncharacterized protein n=1 Tax=Romanomermis culicivorax TaxID=13658 RepID=A0A915J293_ROMCU
MSNHHSSDESDSSRNLELKKCIRVKSYHAVHNWSIDSVKLANYTTKNVRSRTQVRWFEKRTMDSAQCRAGMQGGMIITMTGRSSQLASRMKILQANPNFKKQN